MVQNDVFLLFLMFTRYIDVMKEKAVFAIQ